MLELDECDSDTVEDCEKLRAARKRMLLRRIRKARSDQIRTIAAWHPGVGRTKC